VRSGRSWLPRDGCSYGESCRRPMGYSGRPRPYSRSCLDSTGSEATKGATTSAPKVAPLPAPIFIRFKTLAMTSVNFTTTTPIRLTAALLPVLIRKTN
jgi:hypothetical protein